MPSTRIKFMLLAAFTFTFSFFIFVQKSTNTPRGVEIAIESVSLHGQHETETDTPTESGQDALDAQDSTTSYPMFIVLLSSMPRSGSTFISELLGNLKDSVVFFEPLWLYRTDPCIEDILCVENYLMNILTCNYEEGFVKWLKSKYLFLHYFNPTVRACFEGQKENLSSCIAGLDLSQMCFEAPIRITKLIRARLQWFERILQNPIINMKIIHLTRDPRGSMNSISRFSAWNQDPFERCNGLDQDMKTYEEFSVRYPTKVMQISHEYFCLHPSEVTSNLMEFLLEAPTIPQEISAYLLSHMAENKGGKSMSTFKDSKTEFEAWRWKISKTLLQRVESEPTCLESIQRMNHTVFETIERTKDHSISLMLT